MPIRSDTPYKTIDQYIKLFPEAIQKQLKLLRKLIKDIAPEATETIGYGIPTFDLHGHLVHFAGYTKHIGLYPTPSGIIAFKQELSLYKTSKGSIQFPIDKPLPVALIKRIVKFRVKENIAKSKKEIKDHPPEDF